MKRIIIVLMALALALMAVQCVSAEEIKAIKLRVTSALPPPEVSMVGAGAKMWMDEVTKRTNGKVTFQVYWGGALGKPPEHFKIVESGMADIGFSNPHYTPGKAPLANFEYVFPFGPCDPVIVTKAKRQVMSEFPEFDKMYAKYNLYRFMNFSGAVYNIMSKEPVETLAGFKGKKIALIGRYFGRWVQPAGAIPVVAAGHDRYTMLQTGVIDMDLLPIDLAYSFKVYEQAPYYLEINAMLGNWVDGWFNLKKYNSLPPALKKIIKEVSVDIELRIAKELVPKWTKKILADYHKAGIKFLKLPESDRDKWAMMITDIPAEWAKEVTGQGYHGWKIVARYQELCSQYGYKWPRKWGVKK